MPVTLEVQRVNYDSSEICCLNELIELMCFYSQTERDVDRLSSIKRHTVGIVEEIGRRRL
jgi:hypothetical protein